MSQFSVALRLDRVIEGLVFFAALQGWQAMVREALTFSLRTLRLVGALAIVVGVTRLQFFH